MNTPSEDRRNKLAEVARVFLKVGAMSYGGPAIMGIMQAEIQEKRQWLTKEQFVEGLALVNTLPGPGATQLGIYLGYTRAGFWGGVVAGIGFILPAFFIMLALTFFYTAFGALPAVRHAFYGIGPVVVGIFAIAIYRLGTAAIKDARQVAIAVVAAAAAMTPLGIVATLLLAGCIGVCLYASLRRGLVAIAIVVAAGLVMQTGGSAVMPDPAQAAAAHAPPTLLELGAFFFKVGALTFGGGLSMLAFVEEQVVNQLHWLTPTEFLDGLALGQLTPGPILMLAAFVGYKLGALPGAIVATAAIFLPSFVLMLCVLPMFTRVKALAWPKAFLKGAGPAVIGTTAVSLAQMVPHAVPDPLTACLLVLTVAVMLRWRAGPLPLMLAGAGIGMLVRKSPVASVGKLLE